MKKLILLITVITLSFSCSSDSNSSNNNPTTNIPIGTTVKLECSISSGSTIPVVGYRDSQSNVIFLDNVPNNWIVTFQTTTINQFISLQAIGGPPENVTCKIYINGELTKNATGNNIAITYP